MRHHDDQGYYAARCAEEMERGELAASEAVAAIHFELAYRYSVLANGPSIVPQLTLVHGGREQIAA